MHSRRWNPLFLLVLVPIAFFAACSGDSDDSDSQPGSIQFVVTATPSSTLTSAVTSMQQLGTLGASNALTTDHEGDDDGDDLLARLAHVNVTFSALMARNLDGALVSLVIDLPRTIDLIPIMNGQQVTLPAGTLPPGMYDQIVVVIRSVEFVLDDGMSKLLTPPGGGWTKIIPVETFEVIDGQTTVIELRFNPMRAFGERDGKFEFSPDFECHRRD